MAAESSTLLPGIPVPSRVEAHRVKEHYLAKFDQFAWILDPDGNKVELWEPMNWDEKNKSA